MGKKPNRSTEGTSDNSSPLLKSLRPGAYATDDTLETCVEFVEQGQSGLKRKTAVLTLLSGTEKGLVIDVASEKPLVIGRSKEADIHIKDLTISRKHATIEMTPTGEVILTDLKSSNGSFVNEKKVDRATLKTNDKVRLGNNIYFKFSVVDDIDKEYLENLFDSANVDFLTRAHKRNYFWSQFEAELKHANHSQTPISLLMLDIDHFKKLNDEHGHQAGDYVLKALVEVVSKSLRRGNLVGRYGGEEFAIYQKETAEEGAMTYANRIRESIAAHPFIYDGKRLPVTVSVGCATSSLDGISERTADELLKEADAYLYRAKEGGRNRVESVLTCELQTK